MRYLVQNITWKHLCSNVTLAIVGAALQSVAILHYVEQHTYQLKAMSRIAIIPSSEPKTRVTSSETHIIHRTNRMSNPPTFPERQSCELTDAILQFLNSSTPPDSQTISQHPKLMHAVIDGYPLESLSEGGGRVQAREESRRREKQ